MQQLLKTGYKAKLRPSGWDISDKFSRDNGAAIPPNLLAIPNTESNSAYQRYCREREIKVHPARFPQSLPEFFVRMLTEPGDRVLDPFGGSCVTGEVCERLAREWMCVEMHEEYLDGARGRFLEDPEPQIGRDPSDESNYYRIPAPDIYWGEQTDVPLPTDGGAKRRTKDERKALNAQATAAIRLIQERFSQENGGPAMKARDSSSVVEGNQKSLDLDAS